MKAARFGLVCAITLGLAGKARADLSPVFGQSVAPTGVVPPDFEATPFSVATLATEGTPVTQTWVYRAAAGGWSDSCSDPWPLGCRPGDLSSLGLANNWADGPAETVVWQVPPPPGSASLFISGMLTLGGWHVVRSARHLRLGALPAWYHGGGPAQIGYAVPLDLDLGTMPLCRFEFANVGLSEQPLVFRVRREQAPRWDAQWFFIITAPRGPPALS